MFCIQEFKQGDFDALWFRDDIESARKLVNERIARRTAEGYKFSATELPEGRDEFEDWRILSVQDENGRPLADRKADLELATEFKDIARWMWATCQEETKEGTPYPFWAILNQRNNEWYAGPFFSRDMAESYRESEPSNIRDNTYVTCLSGLNSVDFTRILKLAAKYVVGGNPG